MKLYLSSYKIGNETKKLQELAGKKKIGYISNALDFSGVDLTKRKQHIQKDISALTELSLAVEELDLRDYFGNKQALLTKIHELGGVFISGGNVFVLRQAIKLSFLDEILLQLHNNKEFLYAGYSAAGCVLYTNLKPYQIVDDATQTPYKEQKEVIWQGLGILPYALLPHYKSDHPESEDIDKEVLFCKQNNIPFKTLQDGEVLIIE